MTLYVGWEVDRKQIWSSPKSQRQQLVLSLWKRRYLQGVAPVKVEGREQSLEEMFETIRAQQKEIEYLKRQREILKKAMSILGEEPNADAMIRELSANYEVLESCVALGVSRSGYYQWKQARVSVRAKEEAELRQDLEAVFVQHRGR